MANRVITISRQFGSGGRTVGRMTAMKLGIPCYDQELIQKVAEESGFAERYIQERGEEFSSGGWLTAAFTDREYNGLSLQDSLWLAQRNVILDLAKKGPCVIVGRCADYVLKDYPNVVSVFVHADRKFCLDRSMERHSMTEKEMQKYIEKTDRFRGDFYRYHTGNEWADARNYDLCLNSGKLGFQKCVEEIKSYIKIRFNDKN